MCVFHVFKIVQRVPNRAKHLYCSPKILNDPLILDHDKWKNHTLLQPYYSWLH